jgi:hypothetical protein
MFKASFNIGLHFFSFLGYILSLIIGQEIIVQLYIYVAGQFILGYECDIEIVFISC